MTYLRRTKEQQKKRDCDLARKLLHDFNGNVKKANEAFGLHRNYITTNRQFYNIVNGID